MMSRNNGTHLSEAEHIAQSIEDIVTTPIGSRVMRRNYGTKLADLMDQPINDGLFLKCYSTIYSGILLWEPRVEVSQIFVSSLKAGQMVLDIECAILRTGQVLNLNIPLTIGATA